MASGRAADREDPKKSKRRAARSLDRDPISELHQSQRSNAPHQRAGHMTAPDHFAETELNVPSQAKDSPPSGRQFPWVGRGAACTETAAKATTPVNVAAKMSISASVGGPGGSVQPNYLYNLNGRRGLSAPVCRRRGLVGNNAACLDKRRHALEPIGNVKQFDSDL